jgi:hypothetical protein
MGSTEAGIGGCGCKEAPRRNGAFGFTDLFELTPVAPAGRFPLLRAGGMFLTVEAGAGLGESAFISRGST